MLRYADELREPEDFFDEVPTAKPEKEMVDLAVQLITKKSAAFHPEKFENHYQTALQALVTAKVKGKKIIASPETPRALGGNVVDLMAALRASVEGKAASKAKAKPAKSSKKSA
jgi:DNA end-binding protein Ku